MMMGGMAWMFFWTLLFIALIAALTWLLVRAFRSQRIPMPPSPLLRQNQPLYQQGYSPPASESEIYEEGGRTYPYSEQPSATYPQAPPPQQEQRPRF